MNILPKKSFHVLNKDNVARVRRDEREANEKVKRLRERSLKAEQEWRLRSLRKEETNDFKDSNSLFNEANSKLDNLERREEKEKEKAKDEMKMGLLTFLGGSEWDPVKKRSRAPWYTQSADKAAEIIDKGGKDEAIKGRDDPLALMKAILTPPKRSEKYGTGVRTGTVNRNDQIKRRYRSADEVRRDRIDSEIAEKRGKKKVRTDVPNM